jgi:hypothetical protein
MSTPVLPLSGGVTLACNTPLAMRLHEALRGNAHAGREKTVGWSKMDSATNRNLRLRDASAYSEAQPHLVGVGELQLTPQWQRVEFSETFVDPVVIACAVSTAGSASALIDVRYVEPTGFEIRLQQMIAGAGTLLSTVAGFLVLERGTYTLSDGTLVEAASAVATLSGDSYTTPFSRPFNRIPVVLTAVSSDDEVGLVAHHQSCPGGDEERPPC